MVVLGVRRDRESSRADRRNQREFEGLREKMRATDNDALFTTLRDDYRAGILRSYNDDTIAAAAASFAIMAEHGGPDLVGDSTEMDSGTFWAGYRH